LNENFNSYFEPKIEKERKDRSGEIEINGKGKKEERKE
jgi:hypothetical protein